MKFIQLDFMTDFMKEQHNTFKETKNNWERLRKRSRCDNIAKVASSSSFSDKRGKLAVGASRFFCSYLLRLLLALDDWHTFF